MLGVRLRAIYSNVIIIIQLLLRGGSTQVSDLGFRGFGGMLGGLPEHVAGFHLRRGFLLRHEFFDCWVDQRIFKLSLQ